MLNTAAPTGTGVSDVELSEICLRRDMLSAASQPYLFRTKGTTPSSLSISAARSSGIGKCARSAPALVRQKTTETRHRGVDARQLQTAARQIEDDRQDAS
jgi:hypothetical protein